MNVYRDWRLKRQGKKKQNNDLCRIIEREKWKKLLSLLFNLKRKNDIKSAILCKKHCILHLLLMRNPPVEAVLKITDFSPNIVFELDSSERTPLHYAVTYGASPAIARFLIAMNPEAVSLKDCEGKTPLILACSDFMRQQKNDITKPGPSLKVVEYLLKENPSSIFATDNKGLKASDYCRSKPAIDFLPTLLNFMDRETRITKNLLSLGRSGLEELSYDISSTDDEFFDEKSAKRTSNMHHSNNENIRFQYALNTFIGAAIDTSYSYLPLDTLRKYHSVALKTVMEDHTAHIEPPLLVVLTENCSTISKLTEKKSVTKMESNNGERSIE